MIKYYIEVRISSYRVYIESVIPVKQIFLTIDKQEFNTISHILFLKNVKLKPYFDKEISEEIFNIIKGYIHEMKYNSEMGKYFIDISGG